MNLKFQMLLHNNVYNYALKNSQIFNFHYSKKSTSPYLPAARTAPSKQRLQRWTHKPYPWLTHFSTNNWSGNFPFMVVLVLLVELANKKKLSRRDCFQRKWLVSLSSYSQAWSACQSNSQSKWEYFCGRWSQRRQSRETFGQVRFHCTGRGTAAVT